MEVLGLYEVPGWLLVVVMVVASIYLYLSWDPGYWKAQNIHTARGSDCFFSGCGRIISKTMFQLDVEDYKANGKIWGTYEGKHPVLMVADLELIKVLTMKNFQHFTDRPPLADCGKSRIPNQLLTNLKGEFWKEARSILSPIFTSGKLKQISNLTEECCGEAIKDFYEAALKSRSGDLEISELTSAYTIDVIATCCFGCKIKNRTTDDQFSAHAKILFRKKKLFPIIIQRYFPRIARWIGISLLEEKSLTFLHRAVNQVVGMRKQEKIKRNDFLQLLLDTQLEENKGTLTDEGQTDASKERDHYRNNSVEDDLPGEIGRGKKELTEDAIVSHTILFYLDGFETISNTINFALHLLAENPHCQEQLIVEIDRCFQENETTQLETITKLRYLDMVVSETLRLYPGVTRLERVATEDSKFGGIVIKAGVLVVVPVYCIHHDQEYYPDPEKFDPERFSEKSTATRNPFTYLPFGAGPRRCIGITFALMTIKIFLVNFLKEFRVCPCNQKELRLKKAVHQLLPENGFHVKVFPRTLPTQIPE